MQCTDETYTERAAQCEGEAMAASAPSGHWFTSSVVCRTPKDVRPAGRDMGSLKVGPTIRRGATAQRPSRDWRAALDASSVRGTEAETWRGIRRTAR